MATEAARVKRNSKATTGRIIRAERLVGRLEKRIERLEKHNVALKAEVVKRSASAAADANLARLEKQNASLKNELAKLRARVDELATVSKQNADGVTRLLAIRAPVRALVRSFKETPGAPFETWRMWLLSTFRKQGTYRRQTFR